MGSGPLVADAELRLRPVTEALEAAIVEQHDDRVFVAFVSDLERLRPEGPHGP